MSFKDFYIKEDKDITNEMETWFEERTNRHINLVKKYAKLVEEYDPETFKGLTKQVENHDELKFKEPERTPYIKLTWQHKSDNYKGYKTPGTIDNKEINKATLHHILNSDHHPEFWQAKKEGLLNTNDRDEIPKEIVDATKMPDINVAEMCCDWLAMSHELGTSVKDWADKTVNKRWKFTNHQKDFIYDLINNIPVNKET
jgi:hypothetical protein